MNDDFELLRAWADGDRAAGRTLFERHVEAVRRFFANKVSDAADLVNSTFLACLEKPERFQGRSSFRTYLLSIARFQLYRHYRTHGLAVRRRELSTSTILDPGPSPLSLVSRDDRDRTLLDALRSIPLPFQVILELAYWEDLSCEDLAEILDISVNAVYTRLHRAKRRLRDALIALEREQERGSAQRG